ncbi:MAG TPA: Maf family protein, partial [Candidatus Hydrogenedentes bacterium]|nr:Maf family protein [Candidatus Hydrogenedentota bacterium]
ASASPRRRALLAALGLDFEVVVSGAEETFEGTPVEMVITNARAKRDDTAKKIAPGPIVIAADTLVFLGKHVLGKPADRTEACAMIARLSGKTHHVLTGLSMVDTSTGRTAEGYESTGVTFRDLAPSEIEAFVDAVNPIDRAGAYTVDGPGSLLVARYDGCYQNVLGLPVVRLDRLLRELGVSLFEEMNAARCLFL